jgi:pimeloyl-ACP methyl ester carboxylesterase/DNA-binding CsgD family transcriptional regulator
MASGVRFVQSSVGARIAYTTLGSGPPLIVIPPWISHLEAVTAMSGFGRFYDVLSHHHTVVRYDRWGTGLSDRDRTDFTLAAEIQVVLDLADHLKLRRFALMGPSHGGPVAVAVAHRAARRVSHLILYGTGARALIDTETWRPLRELILANWPAATRAIGALATPGDPKDAETFAGVMQAAATPEMTVALQDAALDYDVSEIVGEISVPTLVVNRWGDPFISPEDARRLAGSIPGARLELVEGDAHLYTVGDVVALAHHITAFAGGLERGGSAQLSPREAEVLRLVAEGCTNAEVAERLVLSVRTVERHLLNAYRKLGVRGRAEAVAHLLSLST